MKTDDPRHGTWAGYQAHRRDDEKACSRCLAAANQRVRDYVGREPIALTDGAWRFDPFRRVQVWVPDPAAEKATEEEVACPTCGALVYESCRTRTGNARHAHGKRNGPRRCRCGGELAMRKQVCDDCLIEPRREVA